MTPASESSSILPALSLMAPASVEVSSRGHQVEALRLGFAPGIDVTITWLPGDDYRHTVETAAVLRRAGFNPVPHVSARELASPEALDDLLARVRGEADVTRLLVISGDIMRTKGPYRSSIDVCRSGLIEARGIRTVSFAGHPEGHPNLAERDALRSLTARQEWGRGAGVDISLVSQFCFESAPIIAWLQALRQGGFDLPVFVGLAGPATPATLFKFALRCGVGNSLRSVRGQIGRFGRLVADTGPDNVVQGLQKAPPTATRGLAGFHIFPFGGLLKAGEWLRANPAVANLAPTMGARHV